MTRLLKRAGGVAQRAEPARDLEGGFTARAIFGASCGFFSLFFSAISFAAINRGASAVTRDASRVRMC